MYIYFVPHSTSPMYCVKVPLKVQESLNLRQRSDDELAAMSREQERNHYYVEYRREREREAVYAPFGYYYLAPYLVNSPKKEMYLINFGGVLYVSDTINPKARQACDLLITISMNTKGISQTLVRCCNEDTYNDAIQRIEDGTFISINNVQLANLTNMFVDKD